MKIYTGAFEKLWTNTSAYKSAKNVYEQMFCWSVGLTDEEWQNHAMGSNVEKGAGI